MAAASGSSPSAPRWKYDVFLSFRGEDTRKIFTSHLYKALKQKEINTFIDSEELRKGDHLADLLKAIQESRFSVVVLSENYASSTWCLKQLVKILDCMDTKKQIVFPIFYQVYTEEVDPSVKRKLKKYFAEALAAHERNCNADLEELQSWRSALTRATDLSGWVSKDYEDDAKLIQDVVEHILNKLMHISSEARGLVGMDSHIKKMNLLLSPGVGDVRVVGIWGMSGIGKTTIARAVYDQVAHQFDHSCFLDNVKEGFVNNYLLRLQQKLLSKISTDSVCSLANFDRGSNMRLGRKKVLVVLDDVERNSQIETLLGKKHLFGEGSRIIITTRDKKVLSGVGKTYIPARLSHDEALELFRQYAFRTDQIPEEYDLLSRRAIEYAQRLPLALTVLGAFLSNKSSVREWENALKNLKNTPHRGIHHVLRMSFDGLDGSQKNLFLDIACFFRGMDKDIAIEILDSCGFFPHSGLRVLVDRALVSISDHNTLQMHDLLQDMGREIVRQETTKDPGERSRLWSYEDVNHVLTQNTATETVESINLDLSKSKEVYLNGEAFVSMKRLRLLKIDFCNEPIDFDGTEHLPCNSWDPRNDSKQHLAGDLKFLSHELRCLIWDGFPLTSLPSNFYPKNLVYLSMRCSHLEQLWEEIRPLKKLKHINLGHSQYLTATPDFTGVVYLEKLDLECCSRLVDVHPSISALQDLVFLSLKGCKELQVLPSSIHLPSLKTLDLSGCSNLVMFPDITEVMKELSELYLDETAIIQLPSSIERLQGLQLLSMRDCTSLVCLPENICNLGCLTDLILSGCSKLNHLPENLGNLASLRKLEVGGSGIKELTLSILPLNKLIRLSCDGCRELKSPFTSWSSSVDENCSYSSLLHLDLSDCNLLELSDGIGYLSSLKTLDLRGNNFERLPATMNRLCRLTHLELESCKRLKSIPELPSSINFIDAHDCTALQTVSTPNRPYSLNLSLTFSNCFRLVQTNLFRDIVESHYQGNHLQALSFNMSLPGSEIPEWFGHQCTGSSVTARLPLNLFDSNLLGFAICAVSNFHGAHNNASDLSAKCFCTFKGNHGEHTFSFYFLSWNFKSERFLKSDHMFLGYVPWSEYRCTEKGEPINEWYYTEATFRIVIESGIHSPDFRAPAQHRSIRSCGVHLFYTNNEVQNLSISQTKYHSDNNGVTHQDFGKHG